MSPISSAEDSLVALWVETSGTVMLGLDIKTRRASEVKQKRRSSHYKISKGVVGTRSEGLCNSVEVFQHEAGVEKQTVCACAYAMLL
jgi:hypothetical protein